MVSKYLLRRVYKKLSLRNVDRDGDGKIDGISFVLINRLLPTTLTGQPSIKIDDVAQPPEKVIIITSDRVIKPTEISVTNPFRFMKSAEVTIVVEKENGVSKGKHRIEISVPSKEYGLLNFDFEDIVV